MRFSWSHFILNQILRIMDLGQGAYRTKMQVSIGPTARCASGVNRLLETTTMPILPGRAALQVSMLYVQYVERLHNGTPARTKV